MAKVWNTLRIRVGLLGYLRITLGFDVFNPGNLYVELELDVRHRIDGQCTSMQRAKGSVGNDEQDFLLRVACFAG